MFNRGAGEKKQEHNFYTPLGEFSYEDLEQILTMLNFLTAGQWVYERDEKDEAKTHFKLGRGKLSIETIATVSSQGAVINISGDNFRIFKINKTLLESSYSKSYQEFKYKKYLANRFQVHAGERYANDPSNVVAIEPEASKTCHIM